MSMTKHDADNYIKGWEDGAKTMIDTIRQALLEMEDDGKIVPLDIYEELNRHAHNLNNM